MQWLKYQNTQFFYIIKILKSMKPNKNSLKNIYKNIYLSLMGPRKLRCDIPNGTTQGWACPSFIWVRINGRKNKNGFPY
jgi:hypothetical protein